VDLNTAGLTGEGTEGLKNPQFRNLRLDDPRVSAAYLKILHKQFEHHNVYRRVKKLQEEANETNWDIMNEQTYEGVDKDITAAMHHAEKLCKLQKQHLTPWANSVGQGTNVIRYWDVSRHLHDGVLNYYLARSDVDNTMYIDLPIVTCTQEAVNARSEFKDTMRSMKENVTQYETEVATARVERKYPHLVEGNVLMTLKREAKIQKELKRRENKRVSQGFFKKHGIHSRGYINPSSIKNTSMTRLEILDQDRVWKEIQGKGPMEEHIAQRNVEQFSHRGKTPLGYTELGDALGHTGDSPLAEDILDGKADHPAFTNEALHAIVKQLRRHTVIQKIIKPVITVEDFRSTFKCVPEKTASSYSGRGIPHYKACAENMDDSITDAMCGVHAAMMSIPLVAGFCPERWKHVIDVMLEKIPGVVRTNKLRIIQLLEADLNQVLRIAFASNITKLARDNEGVISNHQYGRSHKTCISPIFNKMLTIQLLIQKKVNGIVFDNDAKGCYDRIISGVSLATLRCLGYSRNSVRMLGLLWAQMQHHICTGVGVSKDTYRLSVNKLLYGIGQGGCALPIIWVLLNQIILAALEDKFDCIRLVAVDGVEEHIRPGDSFVDDTTCGVTDDNVDMEPVPASVTNLTDGEEALVGRLEEIIHFFLDLLQVTGGDLAPEKRAWFLIAFIWKEGKASVVTPNATHRGIELVSQSTGT
jgi:hypothetical protein